METQSRHKVNVCFLKNLVTQQEIQNKGFSFSKHTHEAQNHVFSDDENTESCGEYPYIEMSNSPRPSEPYFEADPEIYFIQLKRYFEIAFNQCWRDELFEDILEESEVETEQDSDESSSSVEINFQIQVGSSPSSDENLSKMPSYRSHFTRNEEYNTLPLRRNQSEGKISYEKNQLLYFCQSPHSSCLPSDWETICERCPAIIRDDLKFDQNSQ